MSFQHLAKDRPNSYEILNTVLTIHGQTKFMNIALRQTALNDQFGTYRGLIRLLLSRSMDIVGAYSQYRQIDWSRVERLVPVCWGNICRSPFADVYARRRAHNTVSLGLSTTTGLSADPMAVDVGAEFDVDLMPHRAVSIEDFDMRPGDLYLMMEDRHIRSMANRVDSVGAQMALLGLWCEPKVPLLYDPKSLSPEYFRTCYGRIQQSLDNLIDEWEENRRNSE